MTATVETAPEETLDPAAETPAVPKAAGEPKHRHRTVRHVAVHGGSAGVVSVAAEVLHVFGPSALGLGAAGVAAAGAGVVAARRRGKARSGASSRKSAVVRTIRRSVKSAPGSRSAAGLGRGKTGSGAAGKARPAPRSASGRATSAGLRGGASRRAAGAPKSPGRGGSAAGRGAAGKTLHRRTRKPSVIGGGRGASGTRRLGGASRRGGADPRNVRLGTKAMRRLTRVARTKDAAAAAFRPAGKHAAPVTRAGKVRKKASVHGRAAARVARRQAARSWRFAKAGAKATRPYFRLRPPKGEQKKPVMRVATKPASAKTAKKPTAATANKPATETAKAAAATKKTVKKTPAHPGSAITAPGLTVKEIMDTNAPSIGITAAADAITEHIAGFEPENVIDIMGFLSGLDHLFSTLGSSLITVSEKLGSEHPVDASVVDMLQQMGSHALNLGEYGTTAHGLFRAAHETELQRLEQPRVNEQEWDVERNR